MQLQHYTPFRLESLARTPRPMQTTPTNSKGKPTAHQPHQTQHQQGNTRPTARDQKRKLPSARKTQPPKNRRPISSGGYPNYVLMQNFSDFFLIDQGWQKFFIIFFRIFGKIKLDANKNGKIDAQDFKMLKNK